MCVCGVIRDGTACAKALGQEVPGMFQGLSGLWWGAWKWPGAKVASLEEFTSLNFLNVYFVF